MEEQILDQDSPQTNPEEAIQWNYAGFWIRFLAYFIDSIILGIANIFITFSIFGMENFTDPESSSVGSNIVGFVLPLLYFSLLHSSAKQATLGKMAVGIKVVDGNQGQISFLNAVGRFFSKFVSAIILLIGFIMAGFDSKKQALHDKMAGTYVVYEN